MVLEGGWWVGLLPAGIRGWLSGSRAVEGRQRGLRMQAGVGGSPGQRGGYLLGVVLRALEAGLGIWSLFMGNDTRRY